MPSKKFPVLIAFISISLLFCDRELHNFPSFSTNFEAWHVPQRNKAWN